MSSPFVPFDIPFSSTPEPDVARAMLVNCNGLLKQVQQRLRDVGAECINECNLSITECRRCLASEAAKPVELAATKMQKARLAAYQWGMGLLAQCAEMITSVETATQQGTNPSVHLAPPGSGNQFTSNLIDPNSAILQGTSFVSPPKPNDPTKRYEVRRGKPVGSSSYVCNIHYMDSQPPPEVQWPDSVVIADNLTLQQATVIQTACPASTVPTGGSPGPLGRPSGGPSPTAGASFGGQQPPPPLNPIGPLGHPLGGPKPVVGAVPPVAVVPADDFPSHYAIPGDGSKLWCVHVVITAGNPPSPGPDDEWIKWGLHDVAVGQQWTVGPDQFGRITTITIGSGPYSSVADIPFNCDPSNPGFLPPSPPIQPPLPPTPTPAPIPLPPAPPQPLPQVCPTSDLYDVWHTQDGECYCIPTGNAANMQTDTLIASGVSAQACPQVIALACGDVPACRPMRQCEPQTLELASVQAWYAGIEGGSFRKDAKAYLGKAFAYSDQFTDIDAMYTASRQALSDALYSGGGALPTIEEGEYGS